MTSNERLERELCNDNLRLVSKKEFLDGKVIQAVIIKWDEDLPRFYIYDIREGEIANTTYIVHDNILAIKKAVNELL